MADGPNRIPCDMDKPKEMVSIEVYSSSGKRLNESSSSYQSKFEIDMTKYPAGTYYLRLIHKDIGVTKLFVKD